MADYKLIGKNYSTPDLVAKVTGRAKYAEDFRAEGMLFTKLLLSPMPNGRVRNLDTSAALAMPGVEAILTADDLPEVEAPGEQMLTNEPLYEGEPILAVAAVTEEAAADAIEQIRMDLEPLPFALDPLESRRLLAILAIGLGGLGGAFAWRRIRPDLRARNRVEQVVLMLLIAASRSPS